MNAPADGKTSVRVTFEPGPGHAAGMQWQLFLTEGQKTRLKNRIWEAVDSVRSEYVQDARTPAAG